MKPLSDFSRDTNGKHTSICKECKSKAQHGIYTTIYAHEEELKDDKERLTEEFLVDFVQRKI